MGSAFTPTFSVSDGSVTEPKLAAGATLKLGTEQASTSGTAIDFTGIPAGTKQIIVMFIGVSTNGAGKLLCRLSTSATFAATGYLGAGGNFDTSSQGANAQTTGFAIGDTANAAGVRHGQIRLVLEDSSDNTWSFSYLGARSDSAVLELGGGRLALAGVLDGIRIVSSTGDTFDAGSINIAYK